MADITISPIPYGGGTIQTVKPYHIAPLTSDYSLWVYFFQQTSPDYHVLGLAQVTPSITDSSPTITILKQRAFTGLLGSSNSDRFQLLVLSPTKIVLIKRGDFISTNLHNFYFFDIISNDFIYDGTSSIDSFIRSYQTSYYTLFTSYYDGTDYYLICPVKPYYNPSSQAGKMHLKIFKNPDSTTDFYNNPFISRYLYNDNYSYRNYCKINYWELRNKLLLVNLTYRDSTNKDRDLYLLANLDQAKIDLLSPKGPESDYVPIDNRFTPIVFPTSSNICYFQQSNFPAVISKLSAGISSVETGLYFINSSQSPSPYPLTVNYGGGEILGNNTFINYDTDTGPFSIKLFYMDETNQRVAESLETQGTYAYPITSSAGETRIFFQDGRLFGKIDTFTYIFGKELSTTEPRWELKVKRLEAND